MSKKQRIVLLSLFFLVLSGCRKEKESFIKPYYDKMLACLDENHPYIEKSQQQNFELSEDATLFEKEEELQVPHVVFNNEGTDLCANVKVEKSWWDSLPEEYDKENPPKSQEDFKVRKQDATNILFFTCFVNHVTGVLDLEELDALDDEEGAKKAVKLFEEMGKIVAKCGPEVVPLSVQSSINGFDNLFTEELDI